MAFRYSPRIVTDGLIMYVDPINSTCYPGSGTVFRDLINLENTGSLLNGTSYQANKGFVFDGIDDYNTLPHIDRYNSYTITNEITVMALFYWDKTADATLQAYTGIIDKGGYNNGFGAIYKLIGALGTNYNVYINLASGNIQRTVTVSDTNFNYLGFTATGTTSKMYLNDTVVQTNNYAATTIVSNTQPITIGKRATHSAYHYGPIMSLQMYNRALSQTEITQNYNTLKARYGR
jgi:hypothetical protein